MEKEIFQMRGDLAMLVEFMKDNAISDRKEKKVVRRYTIKNEGDIDVEKGRLKQKMHKQNHNE